MHAVFGCNVINCLSMAINQSIDDRSEPTLRPDTIQSPLISKPNARLAYCPAPHHGNTLGDQCMILGNQLSDLVSFDEEHCFKVNSAKPATSSSSGHVNKSF